MRNRNIDLYRVVCMFLIIGLHFFNYSGALELYNKPSRIEYYITWSLEALCYLGVNGFVLITGYFTVEDNDIVKKIIRLIISVWIYSMLGLLIGVIANINGMKLHIGFIDIIHALTPVISGDYWFVTSYIVLLCFIPCLNGFVKKLDIKQYLACITIALILFSVVPSLMPWCDVNLFLWGGANSIWFAVLYITGCFIKMYFDNYSSKKCILVIVAIIIILTLSKTLIVSISSLGGALWYHHNNIFVYFATVALFLLFKNSSKISKRLCKIVDYITPSVFGIYLIHDNIFIKQIIWTPVKSIVLVSKYYVFLILPVVFVVFVIALIFDKILVDKIKIYLFDIKHIDSKIEKGLRDSFRKIMCIFNRRHNERD